MSYAATYSPVLSRPVFSLLARLWEVLGRALRLLPGYEGLVDLAAPLLLRSGGSDKEGDGPGESDEEDMEDDDADDDDGDLDDEDVEEEPEDPGVKSEWSAGPSEEDFELIRMFLGGDEAAFNRLVIRYQNKIHNLCYRVIGDYYEAQDMAQEVFMTVHKSLETFRGDSLFSTWIYRVTVNHCKNRIKFLARRRYYQSTSMDQPQQTEDGEMYTELSDEEPDPEDVLQSRQAQELVQEAIEGLDPDHRVVIVLRDIQELSYEEIAEILDIKVGTVKSRIHRARHDLKRKLEGKIKQFQGVRS